MTHIFRRAGAAAGDRVERGTASTWVLLGVAAVLAILGWLWLREPAGTINPQLTMTNMDGRVTYSGLVRDERTRTAIADAVRATFGASNVTGDVVVDPGVKRIGWLSRAGELFGLLKRPGVEFSVDGETVSLGGWVSAADRQALADKLRGFFGTGVSFGSFTDAAVTAVRTANTRATAALSGLSGKTVPADAVVNAVNLAVINFASGSSDIPPDAREILRLAAAAIKRTPPGTTFEIQGHTDNTGDPSGNLKLSKARAEAVKAALITDGVRAAGLATMGYGDSKPIATNDTEFGRFQNRRIEFAQTR